MQQQRKTVKQDEILFGKVLYTLLYLKRITARPAVSTGPACSVVGGSLDGRGCGEEWIHVYVRLGPLTGPPKLPLHCWLAIVQYKIKSLSFEKKDEILQPWKSRVFSSFTSVISGFPGGASGKGAACERRSLKRWGFDPQGRARPPTPIFLPGGSLGPRNLAGYSSWGQKESNKRSDLARKGSRSFSEPCPLTPEPPSVGRSWSHHDQTRATR